MLWLISSCALISGPFPWQTVEMKGPQTLGLCFSLGLEENSISQAYFVASDRNSLEICFKWRRKGRLLLGSLTGARQSWCQLKPGPWSGQAYSPQLPISAHPGVSTSLFHTRSPLGSSTTPDTHAYNMSPRTRPVLLCLLQLKNSRGRFQIDLPWIM